MSFVSLQVHFMVICCEIFSKMYKIIPKRPHTRPFDLNHTTTLWDHSDAKNIISNHPKTRQYHSRPVITPLNLTIILWHRHYIHTPARTNIKYRQHQMAQSWQLRHYIRTPINPVMTSPTHTPSFSIVLTEIDPVWLFCWGYCHDRSPPSLPYTRYDAKHANPFDFSFKYYILALKPS